MDITLNDARNHRRQVRSPAEAAGAFRRAAAATTDQRHELFRQLESHLSGLEWNAAVAFAVAAALGDVEPSLRARAARAVGQVPWPVFVPLVEPLAVYDPDAGVRDVAATTLSALRTRLGAAEVPHVTYVALLYPGRTADRPSGLARRIHIEPIPLDQALGRDLVWRITDVLDQSRRGPTRTRTVEVSRQDADRHIEHWLHEAENQADGAS